MENSERARNDVLRAHGYFAAEGPLEHLAVLERLADTLLAERKAHAECQRERGDLRQRVQKAEKAARVTIDECRRQGISMGRSLANYAATQAIAEAEAMRPVVYTALLLEPTVLKIDSIGGNQMCFTVDYRETNGVSAPMALYNLLEQTRAYRKRT